MTEPAHGGPAVVNGPAVVTGADGPVPAEAGGAAPPRRGRRIFKRVLIGVLGTVAVLLLVALVLYLFGGPGGMTREVRAEYESLVASGQAPVVQDRFVIPIPGCTCHSDDPVLIVQHSERRMRECFGTCH
jgi:hypothetical protein